MKPQSLKTSAVGSRVRRRAWQDACCCGGVRTATAARSRPRGGGHALLDLVSMLVVEVAADLVSLGGASAVELSGPAARAEVGSSLDTTKYVAHLMPWFENSTRKRGNHWCNPGYGTNYYESVLGTYGSGDAAIIRKQLLLMKVAGVDGVWIDLQTLAWLPTTWAVVKEAAALDMRFAVVLDNYVHKDIASRLSGDLQELMAEPHYYRIFGRPILPFFEHTARWGATQLPTWSSRDGRRPFVIGSLVAHLGDDQLPQGFDSLFFWHSPDLRWLERYYQTPRFAMKVGSVFRGWRESYKRHMHSPPYLGYLNSTLDLARQYRPRFAQLVSWNDYGEGTMLEPSHSRRAGATACGDLKDTFWHSETKTCSELFGRDTFNANGEIPPCLGDADHTFMRGPCSGSGNEPCASVVDCSKPVGEATGLGPASCGTAVRSAYGDLAAIAVAVAGVSEASAISTLEGIVAGVEPDLTSLRAAKAVGVPGMADLDSGTVAPCPGFLAILLGVVGAGLCHSLPQATAQVLQLVRFPTQIW